MRGGEAEPEEGRRDAQKVTAGFSRFQGGRLFEKIRFVPSVMKGVEGCNFTITSFLSLQSLTRWYTCRFERPSVFIFNMNSDGQTCNKSKFRRWWVTLEVKYPSKPPIFVLFSVPFLLEVAFYNELICF